MVKNNFSKFFILILVVLLIFPSFASSAVLSVGKVDYISNDPSLNGPAISVSSVYGFDGSSYIQAGDMKDPVDGAQATKNFEIKVKNEKYTCDYSFVTNNNFGPSNNGILYTINKLDTTYWTYQGCVDATPAGSVFAFVAKLGVDIKNTCFYKTPLYRYGYVSAPTENFQLQFEANNGVEIINSTVISSQGQVNSQLKSSNGVVLAIASWQGGGLKSPNMCPLANTLNTVAVQNVAETKLFRLASKDSLDNYNIKWSELVSSLRPNIYIDRAKVESDMSNLNSYIINMPIITTLSGEDGKSYTVADNSERKTITLSRPFTFPMFNLIVKANWVGVVINTGQPKIIDYTSKSSCLDIVSGVGKSIDVTVKNEGTNAATFQVYGTCQGQIATTTDSGVVNGGQTRIYKVFVTSSTVSEVKETCKLVVKDINNADKTDEASLCVKSIPSLSCTNGFQSCNGNSVSTCFNNQQNLTICPYGCQVTGVGLASCKASDGSVKCNKNKVCDADESVSSCPSDCDKGFNTKMLVFILLGIMGGLFAFNKFDFKGSKTQQNVMKTIVAIIVGLLIFIGVPILFNLLVGVLGFFASLILFIAGLVGFYFANSLMQPGKAKTIVFLVLIVMVILGGYGMYLAGTAFVNTLLNPFGV